MTKTWKDACQCIADAYNSGKGEVELTWEDIFKLHPTGELYWLPYLHEIAEQGTDMLIGLLLTDKFYAKLFVKKIEAKEREIADPKERWMD